MDIHGQVYVIHFGTIEARYFKLIWYSLIMMSTSTRMTGPPKGVVFGLRDLFNFWKITDNISKTVKIEVSLQRKTNRKSNGNDDQEWRVEVTVAASRLSNSNISGSIARIFIYFYARWQPDIQLGYTNSYTRHSYTKIKNIKQHRNNMTQITSPQTWQMNSTVL